MRRVIFIGSLFLVLLLTSCKREKTPSEIFEQQQSGVCLVVNSFYYKITLPTGTCWYCSGIDEDGNLDNVTLDEDEAKKKPATATGTGFFIDSEGSLLTNRHVVSPIIPNETIKKAASNLILNIKEYFNELRSEFADKYKTLEEQKQSCYSYNPYTADYYISDENKLQSINASQEELSDNFDEASSLINQINGMDLSTITVTPISEIGLAYNNTYVTKEEDIFGKNECVVVKVSNDENIDLAKIQLKNKKTPADRYIFSILGISKDGKTTNEDDKELQIGTQLVMIGYNAGFILGNTNKGIQAQMNTGQITQKPDDMHLLYSIPALQGSSGSPVLDLYGTVVAVNFAKLNGTDSFNFGIPAKNIRTFLNN